MKRTITSVAIGAIVTMAGISQAHAWGIDAFKKSSTTNVTQSAGGDARYQSQGKNSGGRDRWEIKNSFNKTNSPEIGGGSKNVFTGSTGSNSNVLQSAGQVRDIGNGTAKNARFGLGGGNFKNNGLIGNNAGASQGASSGVNLGDSVSTGNTYMGTDALTNQYDMKKLDQEVQLKKIEADSR